MEGTEQNKNTNNVKWGTPLGGCKIRAAFLYHKEELRAANVSRDWKV